MPKTRRVRIRSWQATLILTLFFIAVAGAAGIGWWYARESPPHHGPIVLIAVDGLEAARLATLPPPPERDTVPEEAATPAVPDALEALAADAVVFERAYTHSPLFLPSQASLLTGRLPFEHGVRDEGGFDLTHGTRTLAELLRNRGFQTGAVISSPLIARADALANGFGFFVGASPADEAASPAAAEIASGDTRPDGDDQALATAETWMADQRGQRYFLLLQVDAAQAETAVDRVTAHLRERQLYDRATVILVGTRGQTDGHLDEATLHVPFLVKQPHHEGAGRRVPVIVQHADLVPTVLDLVRAPLPRALHGRSLRPLLDEESDGLSPQPVYAELLAPAYRFGGVPIFALTVNDRRYLRGRGEAVIPLGAPDPTTAGSVAETPDTTDPPGAELVALRATLDRLVGEGPLPPADNEISPARRTVLARVGYLAGLSRAQGHAPLTADEQRTITGAHEIAAAHVAAGRPVLALYALQQIAREFPMLAPVHFQIGSLAAELGRTSEAVAALRVAATLRPDAPEIPRLLAFVLARAGQPAEAQTAIEAALALAEPAGPAAIAAARLTAAQVALATDDFSSAAIHAQAAQAADPSLPVLALVEGRRLLAEGAHDEALAALERGAATLRQHDTALEGLHASTGDVLLALRRAPEAEDAFREELREFPAQIDAHSGLVLALREDGRLEEAEAAIERLVVDVPTPAGYAAAARLWLALGDRTRADALRSEAQVRFRPAGSPARLAGARTR